MSSWVDSAIVQACIRGDAAAWRELVDRYGPSVAHEIRATLRRLTGSAPEADVEDVTAEVFKQLVERDFAVLRSFQQPYKLKAWLSILAQRACHRLVRKKRPAPLSTDLAVDPPASSSIQDLLDRLPLEDRTLLDLFYVHECSYEEITRVMGIPENTIRKQKFRALTRLREIANRAGLSNPCPESKLPRH